MINLRMWKKKENKFNFRFYGQMVFGSLNGISFVVYIVSIFLDPDRFTFLDLIHNTLTILSRAVVLSSKYGYLGEETFDLVMNNEVPLDILERLEMMNNLAIDNP